MACLQQTAPLAAELGKVLHIAAHVVRKLGIPAVICGKGESGLPVIPTKAACTSPGQAISGLFLGEGFFSGCVFFSHTAASDRHNLFPPRKINAELLCLATDAAYQQAGFGVSVVARALRIAQTV